MSMDQSSGPPTLTGLRAIDRLPPEVRRDIASHLSCSADLVNLSIVSHAWQEAAEVHIWASIDTRAHPYRREKSIYLSASRLPLRHAYAESARSCIDFWRVGCACLDRLRKVLQALRSRPERSGYVGSLFIWACASTLKANEELIRLTLPSLRAIDVGMHAVLPPEDDDQEDEDEDDYLQCLRETAAATDLRAMHSLLSGDTFDLSGIRYLSLAWTCGMDTAALLDYMDSASSSLDFLRIVGFDHIVAPAIPDPSPNTDAAAEEKLETSCLSSLELLGGCDFLKELPVSFWDSMWIDHLHIRLTELPRAGALKTLRRFGKLNQVRTLDFGLWGASLVKDEGDAWAEMEKAMEGGLQALQYLSIASDRIPTGDLLLPQLTTLSIRHAVPCFDMERSEDVPRRATVSSDLIRLLERAPALRTLRIGEGTLESPQASDFSAIIASFGPYQSESLYICFAGYLAAESPSNPPGMDLATISSSSAYKGISLTKSQITEIVTSKACASAFQTGRFRDIHLSERARAILDQVVQEAEDVAGSQSG